MTDQYQASLTDQAVHALKQTKDFYKALDALKTVGWSERPAVRALADAQRANSSEVSFVASSAGGDLEGQAVRALEQTGDFYKALEALKAGGWSERPAARALADAQRSASEATVTHAFSEFVQALGADRVVENVAPHSGPLAVPEILGTRSWFDANRAYAPATVLPDATTGVKGTTIKGDIIP